MARRPVSAKRFSVKRIEVDSTRLVTVERMSHVELGGESTDDMHGAFVRVRPAFDVTDEEIEQIRKVCIDAGAMAVRVLPRPKAQVVTLTASVEHVQIRSVREVVTTMVEEANTVDRDSLRGITQKVMAEVGL